MFPSDSTSHYSSMEGMITRHTGMMEVMEVTMIGTRC